MTNKSIVCLAAAAALALPGLAQAQDSYISVSGMIGSQSDSFNDGTFTDDFQTGYVDNATPADTSDDTEDGIPVPAGAPINWNTDFKSAYGLNVAYGKKLDRLRVEGELSLERAKVDTHTDVSAATLDLDAFDAAVLVSGADAPLGTSVANLVADGQGDIKNTNVFLNAYYDFDNASAVTPYLGAGVGYSWTNVEYSPSATGIIDDDDSGFAWQAMAGVALETSPSGEIFGGVRYRAGGDVDVDASLVPAEFEIENDRTLFELGYRFGF